MLYKGRQGREESGLFKKEKNHDPALSFLSLERDRPPPDGMMYISFKVHLRDQHEANLQDLIPRRDQQVLRVW
jgi:hypothetical protein